MAHLIDERWDGVALADEPAWHRIGEVVDTSGQGMTVEEAFTRGRPVPLSAWDPEVVPAYQKLPDGTFQEVPNETRLIRRSDNYTVLGHCGSNYTPFTNEDVKGFFSDVAAEAGARIVAAGSFGGGRCVWMQAILPGLVVIDKCPQDKLQKYLLLVNWNTGFAKLAISDCCVRAVCANTVAIARGQASRIDYGVKHTRSIHERVEEIRRQLKMVQEDYDVFDRLANFLAERHVKDEKQFQSYLDTLFPVSEEAKNTKRVKEVRALVAQNFMDREHNALPGLEGSWWTAFNAVTQFVDHQRGTRKTSFDNAEKNRARSIMVGSGAVLKRKALINAVRAASGELFATPTSPVPVDGSELFESLLNCPVGNN